MNLQSLFAQMGVSDPAKQQDILHVLARAGVPDMPVTRPPGDPTPQLKLFDPQQIQADPATYQFRSHSDKKSGVTQKGRHAATRWDPLLHGDPLLVHERLDGSLFVADGHHRLDLAKRLSGEGQGPKQVAAYVLREADGYTAEDAKIVAAYKNIAHGHSSAVETARVFKAAYSGRVHMELLPQLQMDKGNLKMSFSMSRLSDAALDIAEAQKIPEHMAAKVAETVQDVQQHAPVMKAIGEKLSYVERLRRERAQVNTGQSL